MPGGSPSASSSAGASVLSAWIVPSGLNVSVFAAPISRARSLASWAIPSATSLCGIVTFAPAKPAAGSAASVSRASSRGIGRRW